MIKGLVTILIPTYNQEEFIAETIYSVLKQSYKNLEIIVLDDASTDNNPSIIQELANKDDRIIPVLSKLNGGFSKNMNRGFELSKGEFIAKLDGDDIMLPDKILKQVEVLQNQPEVDLVLHDMEVFDSRTNEKLYDLSDKGKVVEHPTEWCLQTNWLFVKPNPQFVYSSVLARATYIKQTLWDERIPYKNELLHVIGNYALKPNAKWKCIPEVLGRYRYFENSMSRSKKRKSFFFEEVYTCFALALALYPQIGQQIVDAKRFYQYRYLIFEDDATEVFKMYKHQIKAENGWFFIFKTSLMRVLAKTKLLYILNKPFRMGR